MVHVFYPEILLFEPYATFVWSGIFVDHFFHDISGLLCLGIFLVKRGLCCCLYQVETVTHNALSIPTTTDITSFTESPTIELRHPLSALKSQAGNTHTLRRLCFYSASTHVQRLGCHKKHIQRQTNMPPWQNYHRTADQHSRDAATNRRKRVPWNTATALALSIATRLERSLLSFHVSAAALAVVA